MMNEGMQGQLIEARRREYLAALGLPLFMARAPLPGAAVSVVETVTMAQVPPPVRAAARPAEAAPVALPPVRRIEPEPVAPPSRPEAGPAAMPPAPVPAQAPAPVDLPSFSCRLLRLGPDLAVLMDLGDYPDLGLAERQLWQAICRAFDWRPVQLSGDFSWPLKAGPRGGMLGNGSDAARGFLQGWLTRDLDTGDRLLVLGPALAAFVERPHRLLPSLAELLASPLAKRMLWRQLANDIVTA